MPGFYTLYSILRLLITVSVTYQYCSMWSILKSQQVMVHLNIAAPLITSHPAEIAYIDIYPQYVIEVLSRAS